MVNLGSGMKLVARHNKRTPAARARDEKETHRITVSLRDDHPLVAATIRLWKRDPGSLDIIEMEVLTRLPDYNGAGCERLSEDRTYHVTEDGMKAYIDDDGTE